VPRLNENSIIVDEKTLKIFAERIIQLRVERNLSQDILGEEMGYSRSAISCFERGIRSPDLKALQAYSDFFDVPVDYLIGKTDIKKPLYRVACFSNISEDDYARLTKAQQKQIKDFIEYVMNSKTK